MAQEQLDNYQNAFCHSNAKGIRLLAPAGSGKTLSLLWRCKWVFEQKKGSAKFLIFTFTRAARDELKKRLAQPAFSEVRSSIEIATLNSWGFRRVRQNHHSPKLHTTEADRSFCVQNALQPIWRNHEIIQKAIAYQKFAAGKTTMNLLDLLKSLGFRHSATLDENLEHLKHLRELGLGPLVEAAFRDLRGVGVQIDDLFFDELFQKFLCFWSEAVDHLIGQSLFTLDDQKYVAWIDILEQIASGKRPVGGARYTHILVDEFQDINPLDLYLINSICELHDSDITIVGDDDQAIFEWRGATFQYIVNPEKHLKRKLSTYILERNYRSPKNIVHHSQLLIKRNKFRVPKNVIAIQQTDAIIEVKAKPDFHKSIDYVLEIIKDFRKKIKSGKLPKESKIAILSRKRAQLIPYQILLASEEIPFCAAEDLHVFLSNAFESLSDLLEVAEAARSDRARPRRIIDDILSLASIVKRYPLSKADRSSLAAFLGSKSIKSYAQALDLLESYAGPLKGGNEQKSMSKSFSSSIRSVIQAESVSDILDAASGMQGMEKDYGKSTEDIFFADPPFFYLSRFAGRYGDDISSFINDLDKAKTQLAQVPVDEDEEARALRENSDDVWARPVHLMTALRAKGKEFDTVVMLDVNDGIWPSVHAETDMQKEQERRLFYVAMTRAKRRLVLTLSGRIDTKVMMRSPFISEAGL
jgi:DNA helicase-2/ATP-dependent DNA helicase PcrA